MGDRLFQIYITARNPKYFLWVLFAYIAASLYAHIFLNYDGDLGLTNLILSIESSTAGAVLMVVAEASGELCERMLKAILELVTEIRSNTQATLAIAQAQYDMQRAFVKILNDPRILKALGEHDGADNS